MKIAILNRSDSTGGAAVVTLRLAEALRNEGHDVKMLVTEKLTDRPWVVQVGSTVGRAIPFLRERMSVWMHNRFDRETLFKIDPATAGLDLASRPEIAEADAILVNWVNQGMLSLRGMRKLLATGKPVIWTMHDMWCFTGICHHSGTCTRYLRQCGHCPLLKDAASGLDLSRQTWHRKDETYPRDGRLAFVAVSRWLAEKARQSSLLHDLPVKVIPNAFDLNATPAELSDSARALGELLDKDAAEKGGDVISMAFGAARLDDPIKGLPILREALEIVAEKNPVLAGRLRLVSFGALRDGKALDNLPVAHIHLGTVATADTPELYRRCRMVVSSSHYETLPGTLVEGQAQGALPVAFDHGGQRDIVDHQRTGYLARWSERPSHAAANLAEGLMWAAATEPDREALRRNVEERFDSSAVAGRYLALIESL